MSYYTQTEANRAELLGMFRGQAELSLSKDKRDNVLTVKIGHDRFNYRVNEWDAESYDILESLIWEYLNGDRVYAKRMLTSYGLTPCDAHALEGAWVGGDDDLQQKTYVKASKILGKEKIDLHLINGMIKKIGLSIDYLKTMASFDFSNTSAVLWKGIYVCPVSLVYEMMKQFGISKEDAEVLVAEILKGE